ncbi:hypothetical protein [Streptomyces sp. NPDC087437]|uniref:hypothetical protein n=1 Tax=Streptomyces sp. NPDC087437 TaxID=3365789 RepID=UPI0038198095
MRKPDGCWCRRSSAKSSTSAAAASVRGRSPGGRPLSRTSTGNQLRRMVNKISCPGQTVAAGGTSASIGGTLSSWSGMACPSAPVGRSITSCVAATAVGRI